MTFSHLVIDFLLKSDVISKMFNFVSDFSSLK